MITLQIKRHTHPHMLHVRDIIYLYICHKYTVWFLCRQKRYSFHHGSHHGISFHHSKCLKPKSLIWPGLIGHTRSQIAHLPLQRHIFRKARVHFSRRPRGWEASESLNLKGWRGRRKSLSGWYQATTWQKIDFLLQKIDSQS